MLNNLHSLTLNVGWDALRKLLVLVAVTGSAGSAQCLAHAGNVFTFFKQIY